MGGEEFAKIGETVSAGTLSTMYRQVLGSANYKRYKFSSFKNISDGEMREINMSVQNLFRSTEKNMPKNFDIKDKKEFLAGFMHTFRENYYEGMAKNGAMKDIHGFRGSMQNWKKVVDTDIKELFVTGLSDNAKKNTLRYGLDTQAPNLSKKIVTDTYEALKSL